MTRFVELPTPRATADFGRRLGELLFPGAIIALVGEMGAGKTTLVRAIAEGLGADPRFVSSPTFGLIHEYEGRLPIYHFDTYRLPDANAFAELGVAEYFAGDGVCLIEWADRVADLLPTEHLRLVLSTVSDDARKATLTAMGERHRRLLAA